MPRVYLVERPEPNAFATGRDPKHAAIAVTTGLLEAMDERQLIGVLAHELSHVKNRDTLIGTIAATIGGTISFLAQMGQFQLIFGGGDDDNGNPLIVLRRRDPRADRGDGHPARGLARPRVPGGLDGCDADRRPGGPRAGARDAPAAQQRRRLLARMRGGLPGRRPQPAPQGNPAFSHLWIVNPLSGGDVARLFSTHPPLDERIARLRGDAPPPGGLIHRLPHHMRRGPQARRAPPSHRLIDPPRSTRWRVDHVFGAR